MMGVAFVIALGGSLIANVVLFLSVLPRLRRAEQRQEVLEDAAVEATLIDDATRRTLRLR